MSRVSAFDRHIVSWYPGVPARQVADAEHCDIGAVRAARARLGRGTEYGGRRDDGPEWKPETPAQLTIALDRLMREPPEGS